MNHDLRLPQTNKEGLIYGSVICSITVLFMASFNIYLQFQTVSLDVILTIIKVFPIFFVLAMVLEHFIVSRFAETMVNKFVNDTDSFNARLLFTVLFTVIGMSCMMTLIGDVVGHGLRIESGIVGRYVSALPRNFSIVLFIELVIAQPVARKVMTTIHQPN